MLNLTYKTSQNQKVEFIESGLVIEEFGRLNNYAIESKKYVMDEPRFSFTQYLEKRAQTFPSWLRLTPDQA
ncbi:hypothetical protein DP116_15315 [Brasilonema bromeliae SPC951]|uniref:Uncharacterized protein n=1 Tax=Brasilonema bromeliae SPC951 TaxID=385972 RepID=A0ABX1PA20_9CYAN|nr:hypothetical protein [Brasilonema bromeliae SPC951]